MTNSLVCSLLKLFGTKMTLQISVSQLVQLENESQVGSERTGGEKTTMLIPINNHVFRTAK